MAKVTQAGFIENDSVATPNSGQVALYAKTDSFLYFKNDMGVENQLSVGVTGVTSIDVSGGTTGLTTTGSPITTSGTITIGGTLFPRVQSVANAATITPNASTDDCVDITASAQDFTIANPTGTPVNFQKLIIRILDNGESRTITFGSNYINGGVALPTNTTANKILSLGFIYNTANSLNKWLCVARTEQP